MTAEPSRAPRGADAVLSWGSERLNDQPQRCTPTPALPLLPPGTPDPRHAVSGQGGLYPGPSYTAGAHGARGKRGWLLPELVEPEDVPS